MRLHGMIPVLTGFLAFQMQALAAAVPPADQACTPQVYTNGKVVLDTVTRISYELRPDNSVWVEVSGNGGQVFGQVKSKNVALKIRFRRVRDCFVDSCTTEVQTLKQMGQDCAELAHVALGSGKKFWINLRANAGIYSVTQSGSGSLATPPVQCMSEVKTALDGSGVLASPMECGI